MDSYCAGAMDILPNLPKILDGLTLRSLGVVALTYGGVVVQTQSFCTIRIHLDNGCCISIWAGAHPVRDYSWKFGIDGMTHGKLIEIRNQL